MPMYWDAYLADTTHLTTEEHGAYILLLAAMWRRNGWVPDDDRDNARILGLTTAKWKRTKQRLSVFLIFQDGSISQKKLLETWKNTQEKIQKNRENGAKGGRPKGSENKDLDEADGSGSVNPNESIPEPEPYPEPHKKKDTNVSLQEPSPANDISEAVSKFQDAAESAGWSRVQKMNPNRSKLLRARLGECGGIEGWEVALRKAMDSDFLCGRTQKAWHGFSFDWMIKAANFTKLMEGNYDNRIAKTPEPHSQISTIARAARARRASG